MVILVMGVTGAGKTTVGALLAEGLEWAFLDADDFHSATNREKMRRGIPLDDADRAPWLNSIHRELVRRNGKGENVVLACSALKESYRETLSSGLDMKIVFLRGSAEDIHRNLAGRTDHFAGENLVPSQLAVLEEPSAAIVEDVARTPKEIVSNIRSYLNL